MTDISCILKKVNQFFHSQASQDIKMSKTFVYQHFFCILICRDKPYIKCFLKYLADVLPHMIKTTQPGEVENNLGCLI